MKSDSQEWRDAYNRDTHVPDNYARSSFTENLAQFPGLIIYDRYTGRLGTHGDISRIGHQLQKVSDQCDWNSQHGGRVLDIASTGISCTRRWDNDIAVRADNGQPVNRRLADGEESPEDTPPEGFRFAEGTAEVEVVAYPVDQAFEATNCTIS